jgi:hypothetical protein
MAELSVILKPKPDISRLFKKCSVVFGAKQT